MSGLVIEDQTKSAFMPIPIDHPAHSEALKWKSLFGDPFHEEIEGGTVLHIWKLKGGDVLMVWMSDGKSYGMRHMTSRVISVDPIQIAPSEIDTTRSEPKKEEGVTMNEHWEGRQEWYGSVFICSSCEKQCMTGHREYADPPKFCPHCGKKVGRYIDFRGTMSLNVSE